MVRHNRACLSLQCGKCTRVLTESGCLFTSCGHMFCAEGTCTKLRNGSKAKHGSRCEQCDRPCDASTLDMAIRKDVNVERAVYLDVLEELDNLKRVTEFRARQQQIQTAASQELRKKNMELKVEVHKAVAEAEKYRNENAMLLAENGKLRTSLRKQSRRTNESRQTSMATAIATHAGTGNTEFLSRVTSDRPPAQPARRRNPRTQLPPRPSVPMPAPAPLPGSERTRARAKHNYVNPSAVPRGQDRGMDRYNTKRRSTELNRTRERGAGNMGRYQPSMKRHASPTSVAVGSEQERRAAAGVTSRATTYATARASIPGRRATIGAGSDAGTGVVEQSYRSREIPRQTKGITKPLHRSDVRGVGAGDLSHTDGHKAAGTTAAGTLPPILDRTGVQCPSPGIRSVLSRYESTRAHRPDGGGTNLARSRRSAGTGITFKTSQSKTPILRPRGALMTSRTRPPKIPRR